MPGRNVSTPRYLRVMGRPSSDPQSWTDDQLAEAIKSSSNWVSVMRELGFGERSSSAGAIRIVRRRADELRLVKTTTFSTKDGWAVGVGRHPDTHAKKAGHRVAYDPDVIDLFFIIDGDLTMYLIPSRAIAGRVGLTLRTYRKYIVGNAAGLLCASGDAVPPTAVTSEMIVSAESERTSA